MKPVNPTSNIIIPVAVLLTGLFVLAYYQSIKVLLILWFGLEEVSDHSGLLALACSGYLLYLKRDRFKQIAIRPDLWSGALLLGCSLLWFVASEIGIQTVQLGLLPFILLLTIAFAFGFPAFRLAAVPVLVLLFVIPIWWPLLPYLRVVTTAVAEFNLQLINRPVFVEGFVLHLPGGSFLIDDSCAGLRFLLVTALLTLVCKDMFGLSIYKACALGSTGVFLALIANWLRVLVIILVGDSTNMESELVDDHANLGWVIYGIVVLVPFLILNNRLARQSHAVVSESGEPAYPPVRRSVVVSMAAIVALVLASGPLLSVLLDARGEAGTALRLPDASGSVSQLPRSLETESNSWSPVFVNATQFLHGLYQIQQDTVDVHIAYYQNQRQGAELVNVNNEFADGSSWMEQSESDHRVQLGRNRSQTLVKELVLRRADGQR